MIEMIEWLEIIKSDQKRSEICRKDQFEWFMQIIRKNINLNKWSEKKLSEIIDNDQWWPGWQRAEPQEACLLDTS